MKKVFLDIFTKSTSNILTTVFNLNTEKIEKMYSDFFINISCNSKHTSENYKIYFTFFGERSLSYMENLIDDSIKKIYEEFVMDIVFYEIAGIFIYSFYDKIRFSYDDFLHSLSQTKNKNIKEKVDFALRAKDTITNKDIMSIGIKQINEKAISSVG